MVVRHDEAGKVLSEGAQIEVGGNEKYLSFCRKHFNQAMSQGDISIT